MNLDHDHDQEHTSPRLSRREVVIGAVITAAWATPLAYTVRPSPALAGTPVPVDEEPTPRPTDEPTPRPTDEPTPRPTDEPTPRPTDEPTPRPTDEPTPRPTDERTPPPTAEPAPTPRPAEAPVPTPEPIAAVRPPERAVPAPAPGVRAAPARPQLGAARAPDVAARVEDRDLAVTGMNAGLLAALGGAAVAGGGAALRKARQRRIEDLVERGLVDADGNPIEPVEPEQPPVDDGADSGAGA